MRKRVTAPEPSSTTRDPTMMSTAKRMRPTLLPVVAVLPQQPTSRGKPKPKGEPKPRVEPDPLKRTTKNKQLIKSLTRVPHVSHRQQADFPNVWVNYQEKFEKDVMECFIDLYFNNENPVSYQDHNSPAARGRRRKGGTYNENCSGIVLHDFIFVKDEHKTNEFTRKD